MTSRLHIMQKEIFSPVVPVNTFDPLDEAITPANDSVGGADGKHGLYKYTKTHVVYLQSEE